MPNLPLIPHPEIPSPLDRIEVAVARDASGLLRLTYRVIGPLDRIAIPPMRAPAPVDELWKHTCFEAFVAAPDGYYEFNLSPSGEWAAYRFDAYRAGMRDAVMPDPHIAWDKQGRLTASIQLPPDATGPLGLSAVIEATGGIRSFWALAHAPGPPDFHNAACFVAELPSAD